MRMTLIAALFLACAGAAQAGGTVNVSFIEPQKFADAGDRSYDPTATLKQVEQYLQYLGQRHLADGQVLKVEVTNIDLAGELRPARRSADMIRIVRGRADWPRISLRYALEAGGQSLKSGEETLSDLNYTGHISNYGGYEPMRYEKLMLEAWFKARFGDSAH